MKRDCDSWVKQSLPEYTLQHKVIQREADGDNKFQCTEGKKRQSQ